MRTVQSWVTTHSGRHECKESCDGCSRKVNQRSESGSLDVPSVERDLALFTGFCVCIHTVELRGLSAVFHTP